MHCISCALKRKVEKPLLFKQTLKSRFTCLACQHFSFDAKKSLDRERPFSLALRVVSLFSCLSRLAPSVTRVAICVSHVLLDGLQKKERLLVVYCCCCTSRWSSQYLSNLIRPNLSGSHTNLSNGYRGNWASLFVSPCPPECYLQSETKIEPDLRLISQERSVHIRTYAHVYTYS